MPPKLSDDVVIGVIGLGYVGLPLAVEFGRRYHTRGFDTSADRTQALRRGVDSTGEVEASHLGSAAHLAFTNDAEDLRGCDVFVITVPTPIDADNRPDLAPLEAASGDVGRVIAPGNVVVVESTVFPGATEEVCVPIVERESGLTFNQGFFAGYSPERINPGDRRRRLPDIVKVVAGSTPETLDFLDALYGSVIHAGTHRVASLKVAEATKVIENTQRDLNIALVNELALIFERLGLDTGEVLAAAATKWNFLPFQPGLVGGHCIGVDSYYLTYKAQEVGYQPDIILAGRRINDAMAQHVAKRVADLLRAQGSAPSTARVLVLGLAFKENTSDIRNTKVADLVTALAQEGARVDVHDPRVAPDEATSIGIALQAEPPPATYDAVIVAVAHDEFKNLGAERIRAFGKPDCVLFDIKHVLPREAVTARL